MPGLTQQMWASIHDMEEMLWAFKGFMRDLTATPVWVKIGEDILVRCHVYLTSGIHSEKYAVHDNCEVSEISTFSDYKINYSPFR